MHQIDYNTTNIIFQGENVGRVEDGVFYSKVKCKHNTMVSLDRGHLELARQAGARWIAITDRTGDSLKALIEDCKQPSYVNGAFPWMLMVPLAIFNPLITDDEILIVDESFNKKPLGPFTAIPYSICDMGLSPFAFRLYVHLKVLERETEEYRKTHDLADGCRMSPGEVNRAMKELQQAGLIEKTDKQEGIR